MWKALPPINDDRASVFSGGTKGRARIGERRPLSPPALRTDVADVRRVRAAVSAVRSERALASDSRGPDGGAGGAFPDIRRGAALSGRRGGERRRITPAMVAFLMAACERANEFTSCTALSTGMVKRWCSHRAMAFPVRSCPVEQCTTIGSFASSAALSASSMCFIASSAAPETCATCAKLVRSRSKNEPLKKVSSSSVSRHRTRLMPRSTRNVTHSSTTGGCTRGPLGVLQAHECETCISSGTPAVGRAPQAGYIDTRTRLSLRHITSPGAVAGRCWPLRTIRAQPRCRALASEAPLPQDPPPAHEREYIEAWTTTVRRSGKAGGTESVPQAARRRRLIPRSFAAEHDRIAR